MPKKPLYKRNMSAGVKYSPELLVEMGIAACARRSEIKICIPSCKDAVQIAGGITEVMEENLVLFWLDANDTLAAADGFYFSLRELYAEQADADDKKEKITAVGRRAADNRQNQKYKVEQLIIVQTLPKTETPNKSGFNLNFFANLAESLKFMFGASLKDVILLGTGSYLSLRDDEKSWSKISK